MNIWITPPDLERIRPYINALTDIDPNTSPLWGIPFAIKDNIDLKNVETSAACPDYVYLPSKSAAVVERLIGAGAIPVGKTNLDQFATGLVGVRSPYGEVHNALREQLISGGSSAGSAVAVAKGQAAFALGTDTAGSGRVPASLNGLYGFKPTCGAWPIQGVVPACVSIDCVTVMANSLEDCLDVDKTARGYLPTDPWSRKTSATQLEKPAVILFPDKEPDFFGPFATEYKEAWIKSKEHITSLGIPVRSIDTAILEEAAAILYDGPWIAERWADLGKFVCAHPGSTLRVTESILRSGEKYDAASLFKAIHKLYDIRSKTRELLKDAVLVMPTVAGTWTREQVDNDPVTTNSALGRYTNHCNLLDLCALAVPTIEAAQNLPFGTTLFALADKEGLNCWLSEAIK